MLQTMCPDFAKSSPGAARKKRACPRVINSTLSASRPGVNLITAALLGLIGALISACGDAAVNQPGTGDPQEDLHKALLLKNPRYDRQGKFALSDGRITAAILAETGLEDITPLSGLALRELDMRNTSVRDLTPLKGMPLEILYLEGTSVGDISALRGMPLRVLYLSGTRVSDLGPVKGAPLTELNLLGTPVSDLTPLHGSSLQLLWLNNTAVTDLTPLEAVPLVSLTIQGTGVRDLEPLRNLKTLERLHIAETPVTDLSPLAALQLSRLIFSPTRIKKGVSVARGMKSITEIGLTLEQRTDPLTFWAMHDRGEFR